MARAAIGEKAAHRAVADIDAQRVLRDLPVVILTQILRGIGGFVIADVDWASIAEPRSATARVIAVETKLRRVKASGIEILGAQSAVGNAWNTRRALPSKIFARSLALSFLLPSM